MADVGIYTKNADIVARAGANVSATSVATAATDIYVLDVEAMVNSMTRKNWSDLVTTGLNADVEGILREASACLCAIYVIEWDMSSASASRIEFEDRINVLRDRALFAIAVLRDTKVKEFIENA